MASARSKHLKLDEEMRMALLRGLLERRLDGLEEDVARLAHYGSPWDLTMAGAEGRRVGGITAIRRRLGVSVTMCFDPRILTEKTLAKETDLLRVMQGSARFRGGKRSLTRKRPVR